MQTSTICAHMAYQSASLSGIVPSGHVLPHPVQHLDSQVPAIFGSEVCIERLGPGGTRLRVMRAEVLPCRQRKSTDAFQHHSHSVQDWNGTLVLHLVQFNWFQNCIQYSEAQQGMHNTFEGQSTLCGRDIHSSMSATKGPQRSTVESHTWREAPLPGTASGPPSASAASSSPTSAGHQGAGSPQPKPAEQVGCSTGVQLSSAEERAAREARRRELRTDF